MDSSDRLFQRQRSVHQILGGGLVADVVLWREKSMSRGVIMTGVSLWFVFHRSGGGGYTLLSFTSTVLLLLISILFIWSKAASLLNRPPPPLPDCYLTEEAVAEAAHFARTHLNALISASRNLALGNDPRLFLRLAASLLLISALGTFTDLVSLCYICLVLLLTIPVLYDKYEDEVDRQVMFVYTTLHQACLKIHQYISILTKFDLLKIQ